MPARLSDLKRALKDFGIAVQEPKGTSHWKAVGLSNMYPIPACNGLKTEIDNKYIKGLCRCFGIDFDDLMSKV